VDDEREEEHFYYPGYFDSTLASKILSQVRMLLTVIEWEQTQDRFMIR
jgi:hypothetical protein